MSCAVLLVSGSLRSGSTNTAVLSTARTMAPPGMECALYEGLGALPPFNPDDDDGRLPRPSWSSAPESDKQTRW